MSDPLFLPAVAMAAGIVLARLVSFTERECVIVALAFFALACVARWKCPRRTTVAAVLCGCLFLGVLTAEHHRRTKTPQLNADSNEILILDGCLVEPPATNEDRTQLTLALARHARAKVSLTLRDGETLPPLAYGQNIEITAKVRYPRNYGNPGSFDYVSFLARQDIFWTGSARGAGSVKILPGKCGSKFWTAIYAARVSALRSLDDFYARDSYTTGMMQAMLLGDSTKLQKVWTDHFRRTGTYHALVISGLHVTVLAGTLLFLMRMVFVPPRTAAVIATGAAWFYALISGWQPPVVRSAGGFTLFLVARFFYRRGRLLNILAAVAIAFMVFDPDQVFDASFQLSFLSVAIIGALATPLIEATTGLLGHGLKGLSEVDRDLHLEPRIAAFRVEMRLIVETLALLLRRSESAVGAVFARVLRVSFGCFEMALLSGVIQVALALPMIVYFHRVSFTGLTANIIIVPLLSAAVPIGFAAILLHWRFLAVIAGWLLDISQKVADLHVRFEPAWRTPDPPMWLALLFVFCLAGCAIAMKGRSIFKAAAIVATLAIFVIICSGILSRETAAGKLEVTAIDVAQGDSIFIRFPDGETMLVDAGGFPSFGRKVKSNLDIGEDVVTPYLLQRGITHLDYIAMSHAHEDHVGGMPAVIDNFHPRELWTGASPSDDPVWTAVRDRAVANHVRIVRMSEAYQRRVGGAVLDVFSPPPDYEAVSLAKNNDSLVFRLRFGAHTFLLTGDIEHQLENRFLDGRLGRIDVLKVAHHGSRTSTSDAFVETIHPTFAIISVGRDNTYGHPTPEVLSRLTERQIGTFRTDRDGLVQIKSDGRRFEISRYRWSLDHGLLLFPVFDN